MKEIKENVNMKRQMAEKIINDQEGKFFTAKFIGKDGITHSCNGRTGVFKYLKHPERTNKKHEDLLNAFNVKIKDYRNIYLDGIIEIRAEGKIYTF